jgi:hypothetical protein
MGAPAAGADVGSAAWRPAGGAMLGVLLALAAAVVTVASLLLSRRLATTSDGLDGIEIAVALAACLTLPAAVPAAPATGAAHDLGLVVAVAMLGLAVPYALEFAAIRAVSVRTFSVLLSLDAAIAAVAGVLWLHQDVGPTEMAGIGLVVLASTGVMATRDAISPPGRGRSAQNGASRSPRGGRARRPAPASAARRGVHRTARRGRAGVAGGRTAGRISVSRRSTPPHAPRRRGWALHAARTSRCVQ